MQYMWSILAGHEQDNQNCTDGATFIKEAFKKEIKKRETDR